MAAVATVAPASDGGPDRRRWPRPATVAPTGGGPGDGHEIFEGSFHGAQRTGEPFNNRWLKLIGKA